MLRFLPDIDFHPGDGSQTWWGDLGTHPRFPLLMRRELYRVGHTTGEHRHSDFHALYAVRSGRGVHRINGQPFAITRGDVYLLDVGATHAYLDYRSLEIDAFYFPPWLWSDDERAALRQDVGVTFADALPALPDQTNGWRHAPPRFHPFPEAWRHTQNSIEHLRALWRDESAGAALVLRGAFFEFVWELLGDAKSRHTPPARLDLDAALGEAVRLCDEEFARPWTVESLAARAFLSPRHFGELFARKTGQSPAMYLRSVRLERAKTLLRNSSLSIGEVARQCGWNDAAHFSRSFSEKFGASPRAFRQKTT